MGWTMDESQPPKVIMSYDGNGSTSAGLKKLTYDPNATNKFSAEFSYITKDGETLVEVKAALGIV